MAYEDDKDIDDDDDNKVWGGIEDWGGKEIKGDDD